MIRILSFIFISAFLPLSAESGRKNSREPIAVGMQMENLGHGLWVHGSFSSQDSGWSEHRCYIGYRVNHENGAYEIVPVLRLPPLINDSYKIVIKSKQLIVSRRKKGEEVLRLELVNLQIPKQAEQVAAPDS